MGISGLDRQVAEGKSGQRLCTHTRTCTHTGRCSGSFPRNLCIPELGKRQGRELQSSHPVTWQLQGVKLVAERDRGPLGRSEWGACKTSSRFLICKTRATGKAEDLEDTAGQDLCRVGQEQSPKPARAPGSPDPPGKRSPVFTSLVCNDCSSF